MFCPQCGKEIEAHQAYCLHCGARIQTGDAAGLRPSSGDRTGPPWESRQSLGALTGLFRTLKETLFQPSAFFKQMAVQGGLTDPLLYALIVGMGGLMFFSFWDIMLHHAMPAHITVEADRMRYTLGSQTVSLTAIFTPLVFMLWLFLISGVLHTVLLLIGGARAGFEATFRVVSYSVSPFVFLAVPFCGMPVMWFWMITVTIIGFREAHEISGGKAAFAVLSPLLFCCGLAAAGIALFMGTVMASFGSILQLYR